MRMQSMNLPPPPTWPGSDRLLRLLRSSPRWKLLLQDVVILAFACFFVINFEMHLKSSAEITYYTNGRRVGVFRGAGWPLPGYYKKVPLKEHDDIRVIQSEMDETYSAATVAMMLTNFALLSAAAFLICLVPYYLVSIFVWQMRMRESRRWAKGPSPCARMPATIPRAF